MVLIQFYQNAHKKEMPFCDTFYTFYANFFIYDINLSKLQWYTLYIQYLYI